jgi:hypothetical protein
MNRKSKKNTKKSPQYGARGYVVKIPLTVPLAPDAILVSLKYPDSTPNRNNVGSASLNWQFRTSARDVDSVLGNTNIPGFTEWMGLYEKCRIVRMSYDWTIVNSEAFNVFGAVQFGVDPIVNNSLSLTQCIVAEGQANTRKFSLGPLTGKGTTRVSSSIDCASLLGTEEYNDSPYTWCTLTANPVQMLYLTSFAYDPTNANVFTANHGISHNGTVEFTCLFFSRIANLPT